MRNLIESMEQESECTEVIYQSYIASRSQKEVFLFLREKMTLNIILAEYRHI